VKLFPFILSLVIASPCLGNVHGANTTYFVSPTGSDSNNGLSAAAPWQTITKVNASSFVAGNSILFQGGQTFSGTITAPSGGTSANPVTIGSYGSGVATISSGTGNCITAQTLDGWAVNGLKCQGNGTSSTVDGVYVDNGNSSGTLSNGITLNNIEVAGYGRNGIQVSGQSGAGFAHVTVSNCSVHGNTFGATNVGANAGIFVIGTFPTSAPHSDINVKNCQIFSNPGLTSTDTIGNGMFYGGVTSGLIDHNIIHDNGASAVSGSGPSGNLLGYSHNVTIQFNEVYNTKSGNTIDGDGIDLDIGSANNLVQYNWVHDNLAVGLFAFQSSSVGAPAWTGNTYRYNITQNNGTAGTQGLNGEFFIWAGGAAVTNLSVYGNTFFESDFGQSTPILASGGGSAVGGTFANNILDLFLVNGISFLNIDPHGGTFNVTGNAYIHNTTTNFTWAGTTYSSLAAFRTGSGQEGGSGTPLGTTSDANFLNHSIPGGVTAGYNPSLLWGYKFTGSSPMIDGGVNLLSLYGITVVQDFYGNPAIDSTGGYTIGAYGYPK
jgi:hypothetical protein